MAGVEVADREEEDEEKEEIRRWGSNVRAGHGGLMVTKRKGMVEERRTNGDAGDGAGEEKEQ